VAGVVSAVFLNFKVDHRAYVSLFVPPDPAFVVAATSAFLFTSLEVFGVLAIVIVVKRSAFATAIGATNSSAHWIPPSTILSIFLLRLCLFLELLRAAHFENLPRRFAIPVTIVFTSLAVAPVNVVVIVVLFVTLPLLDSCIPVRVAVSLDLLPQRIVVAMASAAVGCALGSSPRRFLRSPPVILGLRNLGHLNVLAVSSLSVRKRPSTSGGFAGGQSPDRSGATTAGSTTSFRHGSRRSRDAKDEWRKRRLDSYK
jgi:hypothetical protein